MAITKRQTPSASKQRNKETRSNSCVTWQVLSHSIDRRSWKHTTPEVQSHGEISKRFVFSEGVKAMVSEFSNNWKIIFVAFHSVQHRRKASECTYRFQSVNLHRMHLLRRCIQVNVLFRHCYGWAIFKQSNIWGCLRVLLLGLYVSGERNGRSRPEKNMTVWSNFLF